MPFLSNRYRKNDLYLILNGEPFDILQPAFDIRFSITDGGVWVKDKNNALLADSIVIGLAVSKKKEKSAFIVDSVAQLSPYRESTTLIQLGRIVEVNKRRFILEVECWCNDSKPWDEAVAVK